MNAHPSQELGSGEVVGRECPWHRDRRWHACSLFLSPWASSRQLGLSMRVIVHAAAAAYCWDTLL